MPRVGGKWKTRSRNLNNGILGIKPGPVGSLQSTGFYPSGEGTNQ
jgi:hypothetical protein